MNWSAQVKSLERSLKKLEAAIAASIAADEVVQRKKALAQTVSGIGPVLASELVAHTEGFTRFTTPRQMVCYVELRALRANIGQQRARAHSYLTLRQQALEERLLRLAALARGSHPRRPSRLLQTERRAGQTPRGR